MPRGQLAAGLEITGGRGNGLFILSERELDSGLSTGDQIMMVGVAMEMSMAFDLFLLLRRWG